MWRGDRDGRLITQCIRRLQRNYSNPAVGITGCGVGLVIEVEPDEIRVFWEDENNLVLTVPTGEIEKNLRIGDRQISTDEYARQPDVPFAFAPRGGLGLRRNEAERRRSETSASNRWVAKWTTGYCRKRKGGSHGDDIASAAVPALFRG